MVVIFYSIPLLNGKPGDKFILISFLTKKLFGDTPVFFLSIQHIYLEFKKKIYAFFSFMNY